MKIVFKIIFLIICFFSITNLSNWNYWIYYWTNLKYAKTLYSKYDLLIIQDYNFELFKEYLWKKICYISVWEFDWLWSELTTLWLSWAVIWYNKEWNSYKMNMWDLNWIDYLLKKENHLKELWCNGLFLDTIWQDNFEKESINITKILKQNWQDSYIIVNNAHNIKNEILSYIDWYMFENFFDFWIKSWSEEYAWYLEQSKEYYELSKNYNKKIYTLIYWNPEINTKRKNWSNYIKNVCKKYNFDFIFSNYSLNKIY